MPQLGHYLRSILESMRRPRPSLRTLVAKLPITRMSRPQMHRWDRLRRRSSDCRRSRSITVFLAPNKGQCTYERPRLIVPVTTRVQMQRIQLVQSPSQRSSIILSRVTSTMSHSPATLCPNAPESPSIPMSISHPRQLTLSATNPSHTPEVQVVHMCLPHSRARLLDQRTVGCCPPSLSTIHVSDILTSQPRPPSLRTCSSTYFIPTSSVC